MRRAEFHAHTDNSNLNSRDSINFVDKLIDRALDLSLSGLALTDHGVLSSHVDALNHMRKLEHECPEKVKDFKLALGSEIYLVDREEIAAARQEYRRTTFYHLVVVAKNYKGYRALAKLSSQSWEDSFHFRGVQRVPTYKDYFFQWAKENKGNIIVSSACLGSEFAQLVLEFSRNNTDENRKKIIDFVNQMKEIFEDDFYIEIQPSHFDEQKIYNNLAVQIANSMGVEVIITTDAHYLSLEDKEIHTIYLKSQNAERETEEFYSSTYLMGVDELKEYFSYLPQEDFNRYIENSNRICEKIEKYSLDQDIKVPKAKTKLITPYENKLKNLDLFKYQNISNFLNSPFEEDLILIQLIDMGLDKRKIKRTDKVIDRIERELHTLWEVSEKLNQRLSSYYVLTKEIVDLIWEISLVGISRGSAGAFYICYILGIVNIDPIKYDLPSWRHISKERPELPDIDIDSEKGKREEILELLIEKYGYDKVLNICTFKKEGTASAIQTACRGLGIGIDEAQYISSLIVEGKTIKQCLEEFEEDKQCAKLIKEINKHERLLDVVTSIEGLKCGKSIHASGIYITNKPYYESNAMMRSPNGQPTTQYDMSCSDQQGNLKIDSLTIECLDRIRKTLDLLLEHGIIQWQGSLRETYDKYLNPENLDLDNKKMFEALYNGEILDAFQYDSQQGKNALNKIKPSTFRELMDGNALMRLTCEGEQPIDRYVRHKEDINVWYEEMKEVGLTEEEMEVMKNQLLKSYGVATTQEAVMRLSMDNKIAGFDLIWANKLRKAIAKVKAKHLFTEVEEKFFSQGQELGASKNLLNYIWEKCILPQRGYAFSEPHLCGYTLILMQEMNLYYKYGKLFWDTACLCINAGYISDTVSKGTDYGAIAKAIGNMEKGFVISPDINKSGIGFEANIELNKALFGLGAINGISNDVAREIINLRPFLNFSDFLSKCHETKIVSKSKVIALIKAGCFDCFDTRVNIMRKFVSHNIPEKKKLTTANIPAMIKYNIIPEKFKNNSLLYLFRKEVFSKNNKVKEITKTQGLYIVTNYYRNYFNQILSFFIEAVEYGDNGEIYLNNKIFDKRFKEIQTNFFEWINSSEALDLYNAATQEEFVKENFEGNEAKWEMESILFYTNKHELDYTNLDKMYNINNYKDIPKEPIREKVKSLRGYEYFKYDTYLIAGAVVDKNKAKNIVTISTQNGIVELKLNKDDFVFYDRKTEYKESWFKKGTLLLINGYRRGDLFIPKSNKEDLFNNPINRIIIGDNYGIKIDTL